MAFHSVKWHTKPPRNMDKGQAEIQDQAERIPESTQQGDRRAHPRYRPLSLAYVTIGENNGGIVVDVSEGGLQLVAAEALLSGEDFRLCIRPSNPPDPIVVIGRIVWLSKSRKSAGFCFVSPSEQVRQQIRRWIAQELRVSLTPPRPTAPATEGRPQRVPAQPAAAVAMPAPIQREEKPAAVPAAQTVVTQESIAQQTDMGANVPSAAELRAAPVAQPEIQNELQNAASQSEAPKIEAVAQPGAKQSETPEALAADALKTEEPPVEPAVEVAPARTEPPKPVVKEQVAQKSSAENAKPFPAAGTPTTLPISGSNGAWLRKGETLFPASSEPIKSPPARTTTVSEGWWTPLNLGILCAVIVILCLTAGMLAGRFMTGKQIWSRITGTSAATPSAQPANPTAPAPQPTEPQAPAQSTATNPPAATAQQPTTPLNTPPAAPNTRATTPNASASSAPTAQADAGPQNSGSNPAAQPPPSPANADTTSMTSDTTALVVPPGEDQEPTLVTFPQEAVTASSSIAIGMTRSVLVAPEPGPVSQHRGKHLVLGKIDAPVPPSELVPDVAQSAGQGAKVRLRVTIGPTGDIESMTAIDGPRSLVPTAENIISDWHQEPTRLDGKAVDSFENITVSFRPQP